MKILHTSDWHLGKRLEGYSRFEEQKLVLEEICNITEEQNIDAVIIAGDIFDNVNPPIEATELLYTTLKRLANNGKRPVVAIAGNHDSPDRIEAPDIIARINGIILIGYPNSRPQTFSIQDGFSVIKSEESFIEIELVSKQLLRIITSPFANELRLKTYLGDNETDIETLLKEKWFDIAQRNCDNKGVNILMSHILMSANIQDTIEEPDGEKPIENISARVLTSAIPPQIQYTALGHLHRFQNISTDEKPIIYSGSPVAYSFSEAMQKKYIAIADIVTNGGIELSQVQLKGGKTLIKKKTTSVDDAYQWLQTVPDTLVELHIECEDYLSQKDLSRLREVHDGIVTIIPEIKNQKNGSSGSQKNIDLTKERKELLIEYFEHKYAQPPNEEIMALFNEVLATDIEEKN